MPQIEFYQTLHIAGAGIYGLTAIGCWLTILGARSSEQRHKAVCRFLMLGPVLGLSLGTLIFGGLGVHYLSFDGFVWSWDTPENQTVAIKHLIFLVFWVSHFHLEIWTQEPLRKLQREEQEPHYEQWDQATRPVLRQLSFNVLLFAGLALSSF